MFSDEFTETLLPERRFKYTEFQRVIDKQIRKKNIKILKIGFSFEKRPIYVLQCGSGGKNVLIFSQMHGNEPVSTLALMDLLNFLQSDLPETKLILKNLNLILIPLLNPDGNEKFDRRNAQGIDINRDAKTLLSPESVLLDSVQKEFQVEFAFNLHDQELYYTTKPQLLQTLIAFLAPECDEKKSVTTARKKAMQLISGVVKSLEKDFQGRIGKYSDVFTPEAFGDTFMERKTSSVLIEAGAWDNDRKKARSAVFQALCQSLLLIANDEYSFFSTDIYDNLPENLRYRLFDLKIKNLTIENYKTDIGIRRIKPTFNDEDFTDDFSDYRVVSIGSLDNFGAVKTFDAEGYVFCGGHNEVFVGADANLKIKKGNDIIFLGGVYGKQ